MMSSMFSRTPFTRRIVSTRRAYSTSSSGGARAFYYQYGTPLVKCTVLASATTMGWQLLWQHLEYQEYRDAAESQLSTLEQRIKTLEEERLSSA